MSCIVKTYDRSVFCVHLHILYEILELNFVINSTILSSYIVPVPYMDTLRKMHFIHPRIHVIGLQKCMTTIPELFTIFKKISNLVNVLV